MSGNAATAGAGVSGPGGFILAVESEGKGSDDAFLVALVVEHRFERPFRSVEIGGGRSDFHSLHLVGIVRGRRFDFELGEGAAAHDGSSRSAERKIGVGHHVEPKG
jgi:hypothetical protein